VQLTWDKGGQARVLETDGSAIAVESSIPSPPGSSLSGRTEEGITYHVKVRGCRRLSEAPLLFRIDGRLFNLERAPREHLLNSMQAAANKSPDPSLPG
jgi:hypothetical protein